MFIKKERPGQLLGLFDNYDRDVFDAWKVASLKTLDD